MHKDWFNHYKVVGLPEGIVFKDIKTYSKGELLLLTSEEVLPKITLLAVDRSTDENDRDVANICDSALEPEDTLEEMADENDKEAATTLLNML